MKGKFWTIGIICLGVVLSYAIMIPTMGFLADMATAATPGTTNVTYPFYYAVMKSSPLWMFLIPAVVGIIAITVTLKVKK